MTVKHLETDTTDEGNITWYDIDGVTYGATSDGKILDSDGAPLVNDTNARWAIEQFGRAGREEAIEREVQLSLTQYRAMLEQTGDVADEEGLANFISNGDCAAAWGYAATTGSPREVYRDMVAEIVKQAQDRLLG